MRADLIESFARSALLLEIEYRNSDFGGTVKRWIGTGIIRKLSGRPFLVTALHNLSGYHTDGTAKDPDGALPNFVTIKGFYTSLERPLYKGENNPSVDTPLYLQHPAGRAYDVAVLPLGSVRVEDAATVHESFFAANPFDTLYP